MRTALSKLLELLSEAACFGVGAIHSARPLAYLA